jgi:hypothetical protein
MTQNGSLPEVAPVVLSEILAGDSMGASGVIRALRDRHGEVPIASPSTIWRWMVDGIRASHGRVVKLEAVRMGRKWLTSKAALARFATALTRPMELSALPTSTAVRCEQARRQSCEAAVRRLIDGGA